MCGLVQTEAQDTIITVMGLYKTNKKNGNDMKNYKKLLL